MEQTKDDYLEEHLLNGIDQASEVHLLDYLNLIRKRKWILIACVLISIVTAIIFVQTMVPVYQADCQIIIDKEVNRSPVTGENMEYLYYETALSEELSFNTQLKIITSYQVLEQVINRLGLQDRERKKKAEELMGKDGFLSQFKTAIRDNIQSIKSLLGESCEGKVLADKDVPRDFIQAAPDREMAALVSALADKIEVKPIRETRLVTITVSDESPSWAAAIANALVRSYVDYDTSLRYKSVKEFIDWISVQVAEMKQKIDDAEKKFYNFKANNKIYSIQERQDIITGKVHELNDAYIKTHTERMGIRAKVMELETLLNRRKDRILGKDIVDNPLLMDLSKELSVESIRLDNLKRDYKDKHPEVLDATSKIEILKKEFNSTLDKSLQGLLLQDAVLKSREDTLQAAMVKLEEEALADNKVEITYAMLEREVETNKALYEVLLNKFKETKINETMKKSNIRITEPARIPESPSGARKKLTIVLGCFILGLMGGFGLIFLLEHVDTEIRTEKDVQYYLQLPVIGIIPENTETGRGAGSNRRKMKPGEFPFVTDGHCSSAFSEAYRSLRTNLVYSGNSENPSKVILITSSIPQEGKSTTAANLALALSQAGARVLLVDTDLRVPSVHKKFRLDRNSKGLTNILVDSFNTSLHEGTLEEYSLADIINLVNIQGRSGILSIVSGHSENFQLSFKGGELIEAQWKDRPEEERLGAILVASRRISEEQRRKALQQQDHYQEKLGSILLNMNLITAEDIKGPLTLHFSSVMKRIFTLEKGYFIFKDGYPRGNSGQGSHNYLDESFPSWHEIVDNQAIPFLERSIFSIIQNGPLENMKILTSGPLPSNPSELLSSRRMKALMHILKGRFDYVIMDSPPINSVTDASILASLADGVIMVVFVGRVNRNVAMKAKQQLDSIDARIFGAVLNRLDLKKDGYYYYSYYRYGDYYQKQHEI
ncbi:MAG: polysaccharide biosynthesis tyrosine autokinase [bacterium]